MNGKTFFRRSIILAVFLGAAGPAFRAHALGSHAPKEAQQQRQQIETSSAPIFREGDLIFQQSQTSQTAALQEATGSKWTHVGIVVERSGKWFVAEAHSNVQVTPLNAFIARIPGDKFYLKRIKQNVLSFSPKNVGPLEQQLERFAGRPYDVFFEWSDDRIYCSELVWKALKNAYGVEIGTLQKMGDLRLDGPAVQALINTRFKAAGKTLNREETVITPIAMFESDQLDNVADCSSHACALAQLVEEK